MIFFYFSKFWISGVLLAHRLVLGFYSKSTFKSQNFEKYKKFIFSEFKNTYFLFYDPTDLFLVDIDHPAALFYLVNVDHWLFLLVDVDLPFSSCLFYWSTSTCLFLTGRRSTSVNARQRVDIRRRPFYSPFHHAL